MPPIDRIRGARRRSGSTTAAASSTCASRPTTRHGRAPSASSTIARTSARSRSPRTSASCSVPVFTTSCRSTAATPRMSSRSRAATSCSRSSTHGVLREISLYHAPLDGVLAGTPRWQKLFDTSAGVHEVSARRPAGCTCAARRARRDSRCCACRSTGSTSTPRRVVMPESDGVINDIGGTRDALYVTRREGVEKRLYRVSHDETATTLRRSRSR